VTRPLRWFQSEAFDFSRKLNASGLLMEMRLGKALVALRLVQFKNVFPCLIVGPYSTFRSWKRDILRDDFLFKELTGTRAERLHMLNSNQVEHFNLINKEGFLWLPEIASYPFNSVIVDESSFIKEPRSKVSKFFTKNFRSTSLKMILTGTAAVESDLDYIQQLRFLSHEIIDDYWTSQVKYFQSDINGFKYTLNRKSRKWFFDTLNKHCFFMNWEQAGYEHNDEEITREVLMPTEFFNVYKKIENNFILEYSDSKHSSIFSCEKYIWMRQLCGGFVDGKMVFNQKCEELLYLLNTELKGQKVVIFALFVDEVLHIVKETEKFRSACLYGGVDKPKREAIVNSFAQGSTQVLVIQPTLYRYGEDLSMATTCINYSLPSAETYVQTKARITSLMKTEKSLFINLICKGTIEEDIIDGLEANDDRLRFTYRISEGVRKRQRSHYN
jgi:hypothetical protein